MLYRCPNRTLTRVTIRNRGLHCSVVLGQLRGFAPKLGEGGEGAIRTTNRDKLPKPENHHTSYGLSTNLKSLTIGPITFDDLFNFDMNMVNIIQVYM